jgi:type II secretory pathway pseudopilin PulG
MTGINWGMIGIDSFARQEGACAKRKREMGIIRREGVVMALLVRRQWSGFTMGRLLVTILLVSMVLSTFLFLSSAVYRVRESAARTQTTGHLAQFSLSIHSFNDTYRRLPPAYGKFGPVNFPTSIHIYLLPYIEQDPLFKNYVATNGGAKTLDCLIPPYFSPLDNSTSTGNGIQSYAANLRVFSDKGLETGYNEVFPALGEEEPGTPKLPGSFADGTSYTIVFATKLGVCKDGGSRYAAAVNSKHAAFFGQDPALVPAHPTSFQATFQLAPNQKQCRCTPLMAQSFTGHGLPVGFADARVRTISPDISPDTWNKLLQPNDGNKLGDDWR